MAILWIKVPNHNYFSQFSGGMGIYLSLWIFTVTLNLRISFVVISILLFLRAMWFILVEYAMYDKG